MRTLLIEPQRIFVPALQAAMERAGFRVERTAGTVDYAELVKLQPQCVFVDVDFAEGDPLELIRIIRMLLPVARIAVYTSTVNAVAWQRASKYAGSNAVFSKSADEREFVEGLRSFIQSGTYTDWRLAESR